VWATTGAEIIDWYGAISQCHQRAHEARHVRALRVSDVPGHARAIPQPSRVHAEGAFIERPMGAYWPAEQARNLMEVAAAARTKAL
jgi:hypothetical protein